MVAGSPKAGKRQCAGMTSRTAGHPGSNPECRFSQASTLAGRIRFSCGLLAMTPLIFVTGGVVSSLGKGIAAASLAAILEARGLRVTMMKLDPYINVDPGTMSPFQHGEVYVTDDG